MQPPSRNEINKLRPMKNIEVNRTLWLLAPAVLLLTALFLLPETSGRELEAISS